MAIARAQLLKPSDVLLGIFFVFLELNDLLILHTIEVRGELDLVGELVLDALLHIGLDLRAFLLTLID